MFVIPKKNGGVRPVFNLKKLNQYLDAPHYFKMETIREVSLMIKPNDYLVSIDLSDAFLHIGLHQESRRFLRLKWKNQVYQYCTTAFDLASTSPFIFTKDLSVLGRLAFNRRIQATRDGTGSTGGVSASRPQMDNQFQEIGSSSYSTVGTSRLRIEYPVHDSLPLYKQIEGYSSFNKASSGQTTSSITEGHSQSDNADTGSNICNLPGSPIHSIPFILQESKRENRGGLGSSSPLGPSESRVTSMVAPKHPQHYRMGLRMELTSGAQILDSRGSGSVYQLEGIEGCTSSSQDFPSTTKLYGVDQDRQHNQSVIHQQARRYSLSSSSGISNGGLDMVFAEQDYDPSTAHSRCSQQNSGFRVSPTIFQEPVDDQTAYISTNTANLGSILDQSLCRPHNQAITKLRVVDAGSERSQECRLFYLVNFLADMRN
ncbi:hypothetical protein MAM1_0083c04619 [Mucor ambiguus]|uniref:Reverse transcriptase domain-containing protein n=1 Tax=Mucor ambiguus TaxID=91626 RepID=A0A0C9LUJ8_9FUNG|nr:hypothetical protein MAM1_0083c04619 [Mucor ambiguus]